MDEYAKDPDEYYDLQHLGLMDRKGRIISHHEQHEFMIGYEDDCRERKSKDNLDATIIACLAASCF